MLGWLKRAAARALADELRMMKASEYSALFEKGLEHLLIRDKAKTPYEQVGDVYAAIRAIATEGASVPFSLFAGDERLMDHPVYELLGHPNAQTYGNSIFDKTLIFLENTGECFWLYDEERRSDANGTKLPTRIRFLPPKAMTEKLDSAGDLIAWDYQAANGRRQRFDPEQLVHFSYPNPRDPIRGLSPLRAATQSINIQFKARAWGNKFFENGALPSFFLTWPENVVMTEDQRQRFDADFDNRYTGISRAGRPVKLYQGGKPATVSPNQKEMDWLRTLQNEREQIGGVLGVPPVFMGRFVANFAVRDQKRIMLYSTVFPRLQLIGSILQFALLDRFETGLIWSWDFRAKVAASIPEDVQDTITAAQKLWSMGVPFKDAAEMLGLDADTSDKPWLETGWLPFNLIPADEFSASAQTTTEGARRIPMILRTARGRATYHRGLLQRREALARGARLQLEAWLLGLRAEVLAKLGALDEKSSARAIPPSPDVVIFDFDEAAGKLVQRLDPQWSNAMQEGGDAVLMEAGIGGSFDLASTEAQAFLSSKRMQIKVEGQIVGPVNERVRATLQEGIESEESILDLKARVRTAFNGERRNALDIARTEVGQSFNGGRFESMKQAGISEHQWLTAGDGLVRPSHVEAESQGPITIGQRFVNGLLYPLDPAGPAAEVVNCRCDAVAVAA